MLDAPVAALGPKFLQAADFPRQSQAQLNREWSATPWGASSEDVVWSVSGNQA